MDTKLQNNEQNGDNLRPKFDELNNPETIINYFKDILKNGSHEIIVNDDLGEVLRKSRVTLTEDLKEPPVCLEIISNSDNSTLATLGNFSAVIGKAKSKKTFLITMALAAAIKNDSLLEKFRANLPETQNTVLLFDTEQSKYHVQKVVRRICNLSELNEPPNFHCYGLRPFTTDERIELIKNAIFSLEGIGMVVIDGIRDLVKDINSPEEATKVVSLLMKWSEEKNIHIVVVLHQNKGDNNARGHLGTEVVNKAETVISVTKDTQDPLISIVEAEYCREKDFPPFAFRIDHNGLPYILNEWTQTKEGKKAASPFDYPKEGHQKILNDVFSRNANPQYKEFVGEMRYSLEQYGLPSGRNKAVDFITYYTKGGLVTQETTSTGKHPTYKLSTSTE